MKPLIRKPLRKGSLVYHGTSADRDFVDLVGPAWISDAQGVASHVSRYGEDWVVLFDPRKVVSWRQYDPNDPWDLPRVKRTSRPS